MKDWKKVNMDNYKYTEEENYEDIEFRSNLDLKISNSNASNWAYTLANKNTEEVSKKIYVISIIKKSKLQVGDEIISIDDKSFENVLEYKNYLNSITSDSVIVQVKRNNKYKDIKVKVTKEKDGVYLGVLLDVLTEYKTNPEIDINFKQEESGPSAGVITTLYIYDLLNDYDLSKGRKIAGTGTIEEDGSIGEIGEIKYKFLGAVKDGSDIFIAPSGKNYNTCMKLKEKRKLKIKVIEAKNIKDVINQLEK